jgi:hypothetical protein
MLTLSEMRSQVSDRIGINDSGYNAKIDDWINYRYDDIVGRHDWPQLYRTSTLTVNVGDSVLALPRDCALLLNIQDRTNNINLAPLNPSAGGRGYLDSINTNGLATVYWWEGVSMLKQPSSASVITFASANASDTSQTIRVWGIDSNGAEQTESVSLNGTTNASTTNSYTRVDRISKDANTLGIVTATSNSAAVTVAKIDPYNFGTSYNQIRIVNPSANALSFNITYKIKVPRLINDEDVPMLDSSHALVVGAYIDALRQQRQHTKAKVLEYNQVEPYDPTTYEGKVRSMIQKIDQQAENVPVMWPMVDRAEIDTLYRYRT